MEESNKLIKDFENVFSSENINDYIKKGEAFYNNFCSQIIKYSKNDDMENIKTICTDISKTNAEFHYLSFHFSDTSSDELMLIKGLLSRILDILQTKAEDLFMKLGNNPQITKDIIHAHNHLNTLCRNLIYIDLKKLIHGLDNTKLTLSDIDIESIINLLNSLPKQENTFTETSIDRFTYQSFIIRTAEQVSYSNELRLIIPLLFYLEKHVPLNPLDLVSGFKKSMHIAEIADEQNNPLETIPALIELFIKLCEKSRTEGLLSLEDDIDQLEKNNIVTRAVQLIVDGTDPDIVSNIIGNKIDSELSLNKMENRIITEGTLSIQSGDNPRIVEERLKAICSSNSELAKLVEQFVDFSEKARREGILAIEDNIDKSDNVLLCAGLKLMLNGMHPHLVESVMDILSEIILKYKYLYYQICMEGALGIQQGRSPKMLRILFDTMVPFYKRKNKDILKNNHNITSIFEKAFENLAQEDNKEEIAILIIDFIHSVAAIAYMGTFIESLLKTLLNIKENNKVMSILNNILINALENNEFNFLDFSGLDKYLKLMHTQIEQIIKNEMTIKKQAESFSNRMNEERIKSFDILEKDYARKKPTLKNLGFTAPHDRIASYIGKLGAMYLEHNKQYKNLLSGHITKTTEKIKELTLQFFNFSPELEQSEKQDFLLQMIINLFFDAEDMFAHLEDIFKGSPMINIIIDDVLPFTSINSCPDSVIKSIIEQISREELIHALKGADDYIKEVFFNSMEKDKKNKIMDELEYTGPLKTEEVENARKKIRLLALKHKELVTSLKFNREFRRNNWVSRLPD